MNTRLLFSLGFLLLAFFAGRIHAGAETVSAPGVFSYEAPAGWTVENSAISKNPIARDAPHNGFAANLNVVIEQYPGTLDDYVAANMKAISATPLFVNFNVVEQKSFTTASGVRGARVVADDKLGKVDMRQTFYFFAGSSMNKIVVTASSRAADGDHFAPIFDAAMKTFTVQ
jgi:hypothetical protein